MQSKRVCDDCYKTHLPEVHPMVSEIESQISDLEKCKQIYEVLRSYEGSHALNAHIVIEKVRAIVKEAQ